MKSQRSLFWIILVSYVSLCVWWMSFLPYDRKALYRAVPYNAVYVSEHAELSERWHELSSSPLSLSVLEQSFNIEPDDVAKVRDEPMVAELFKRFARKNTLVSYTKRLPESGHPAWVISSWAGSSGQIARWSAASGMLDTILGKSGGVKLRKIDYDRGRHAWTWESPGSASKYNLSAGFAEGVLVCCVSVDPEAVCHVLRRISRCDPMMSELKQHMVFSSDDSGADRGWARSSETSKMISFGLTAHNSRRTEGWIKLPSGLLGEKMQSQLHLKTVLKKSGLDSIIGDVPGVFCTLPFAFAEFVLDDEAAAIRSIYSAIKNMAPDDALSFSALLGGEFSGHLIVRVPTLLVGVQVSEGALMPESHIISDLLDDFNREVGTAFIPVYEEHNGKQLIVLGGTADDFYGSLKHNDKSVLALLGNWLIYSSNKDVMKRLMNGEAVSQAGSRWLESAPEKGFAGYGWMDLASADNALESGIVAYSLVLSLSGDSGSLATRRMLDRVRGGLREIAAMRSCRFILKPDGETAEIRFVLGE